MINGLSWCWELFCLRLGKANPVEFLWDNLWLLCRRWCVRFHKIFVNLFCRSNTCWENGFGSATSLELEKKAKRPSQLLLLWWESLCALYLRVRVWTPIPNLPHHLMGCSNVFLCSFQLHQQGILRTDDLITRFFRISTELCVEVTYRALGDHVSL